jgi:putative salt-induced outer membrane protein
MTFRSVFILAMALGHGVAFAADTIEERTWSTSAELGAITTSGNTTGTSVTGKIDARQELEDWSNQYILTGFFKEDQTHNSDGDKKYVRSAERFALSARAAYKLMEEGERLFVLGSHVDDRFGAYTRYSSLSVGRAKRGYKSPDKLVEVELGPGYFSGIRATGEGEDGVTVRGAANMRWQISDSALFSQTVAVERGTSNTHSVAETALSAKINGTMQMKAAYSARNDSNVPVEKKNTDTQTSVTLVYSF